MSEAPKNVVPGADHTPGPWKWESDRSGQIKGLNSEAGDFVIYLDADIGLGGAIESYADVSPADARLIEAAPELLRMLWEWVEYQPSFQHYDASKALIAKITGV